MCRGDFLSEVVPTRDVCKDGEDWHEHLPGEFNCRKCYELTGEGVQGFFH